MIAQFGPSMTIWVRVVLSLCANQSGFHVCIPECQNLWCHDSHPSGLDMGHLSHLLRSFAWRPFSGPNRCVALTPSDIGLRSIISRLCQPLFANNTLLSGMPLSPHLGLSLAFQSGFWGMDFALFGCLLLRSRLSGFLTFVHHSVLLWMTFLGVKTMSVVNFSGIRLIWTCCIMVEGLHMLWSSPQSLWRLVTLSCRLSSLRHYCAMMVSNNLPCVSRQGLCLILHFRAGWVTVFFDSNPTTSVAVSLSLMFPVSAPRTSPLNSWPFVSIQIVLRLLSLISGHRFGSATRGLC